MTISFVVTTLNVEALIEKCLESILRCLHSGDQVILVDGGSSDSTVERIEYFCKKNLANFSVNFTKILFGTNMVGHVGVSRNICLDHVVCDTIFFVNGADYLVPENFIKARIEYESSSDDIHFVDYIDLDLWDNKKSYPVDADQWNNLPMQRSREERLLFAIKMASAPWRKFYRADFLRTNHIKFLEEDICFEDITFHWKSCLFAQSVGFSNLIACHHRIIGHDKEMASSSKDFLALFKIFDIINLEPMLGDSILRCMAITWLLKNMGRCINNIEQESLYFCVSLAFASLRRIREEDWQFVSEDIEVLEEWHEADKLRRDGVWDTVESWRRRINISSIRRDISIIRDDINILRRDVKMASDVLRAQKISDEFELLKLVAGDIVEG